MEREKMKEWVDQLDRLHDRVEEIEEAGWIDSQDPYSKADMNNARSSAGYGVDVLAYKLLGEDRLDVEYVSELTGLEIDSESSAHNLLSSNVSGLLRNDDTESVKGIVDDAYEVAI